MLTTHKQHSYKKCTPMEAPHKNLILSNFFVYYDINRQYYIDVVSYVCFPYINNIFAFIWVFDFLHFEGVEFCILIIFLRFFFFVNRGRFKHQNRIYI